MITMVDILYQERNICNGFLLSVPFAIINGLLESLASSYPITMIKILEIGTKEYTDFLKEVAEQAAIETKKVLERQLPQWDWITQEHAMRLLDCSKSTIGRLVREGKIGVSQVIEGGTTMYSLKSINAYHAMHYKPSIFEK